MDFWVEGTLEGDFNELLQALIAAWNSNKLVALQGTSGKCLVPYIAVNNVSSPTKVTLIYSGTYPSNILKTFRTVISATTIIVQEVNAINYEIDTMSVLNNSETKIII